MENNFYKKLLTAIVLLMPFLWLQAQIGTPISSYNELNTLVRADLAGIYYLTNDIEIPEGTEWLPLGKPAGWNNNSSTLATFSGILDGRGYAIKNLKITTGSNFSGLFARVVNGDIKNLRLENVDITGGNPTGALSGTMFGGLKTYEPSNNISNVYVTGTVRGTSEVGGVVGRCNDAPENIITNCYVNANIEATAASNSYAGGIVGCMNTGQRLTINRVYVAGNIKAKTHAAGILGYISSSNVNTIFNVDASAVAASEISGGTASELIYNKGSLAGKVNLTNNYACNDLGLTSPYVTLQSPDVFKTKKIYETTLGWDFNDTWTLIAGNYPTLQMKINDPDPKLKYQLYGIKALDALSDRFYNTGSDLFNENISAEDSITGLYTTKGGDATVWPCAHVFRALTWGALIEPRYETLLRTFTTNIEKYRNGEGYGFGSNGKSECIFDDNAVLSYGLMLVYERMIREQWVLDKSLVAAKYCLKYRDSNWGLPQHKVDLGNGIFYIGAINPMASALAMLYGINGKIETDIQPGESDLYIAEKYYEILTQTIPGLKYATGGLYRSGGRFTDGVFVGNTNGARAANTCGVAVLGIRLYVVTGNVRYLNEAKTMTDLVLNKWYKKGAGFSEIAYWGGNAVIDLLCELYEQDPDAKWYNAAKDIIDFLIDKSRDKRGFYPSSDDGTFGNWNRVGATVKGNGYPEKKINMMSQACAAHAILRFAYLNITSPPTSIPNINSDKNKVSIYPNPARDMLYIQNVDQRAQAEVFTMSGVKILQGQGASINVSAIPSGVYVIQVNTGKEIYKLKFVKE